MSIDWMCRPTELVHSFLRVATNIPSYGTALRLETLPRPAPKYKLTGPTYNFQLLHDRVSCHQLVVN